MSTKSHRYFVLAHRQDDVRQLALTQPSEVGADLPFVLDQIQGWQTACRKLPSWAACDDVVYPPHISLEQCSSEATARHKARVMSRLMPADASQTTLVDLTGGFGVDFTLMSRLFSRAVYVEQNECLCELVAHNLNAFGQENAEVVCDDGVRYLHSMSTTEAPLAIYLDPARRDEHGRKVAALSDCHPDVTLIRSELMAKAHVVMIKLSPMLDIHAALSAMTDGGVGAEVHIVCTKGECKEMLLVLTHSHEPLRIVCVDDDTEFAYRPGDTALNSYVPSHCKGISDIQGVLLVPHAGIMKAQCFKELSARFSLCKISKTCHLFVAASPVEGFPGRQFRILRTTTMNKKVLRQALSGITHANIAVRDFPLTAEQLRKKLKLKDGSSNYLFATNCQKINILIFAEPISPADDLDKKSAAQA